MKGQDYQKCAAAFLWFGNRVMLGERFKGHWKGYFGGVGGKIEQRESIIDGLIREITEEAEISVNKTSLRLLDCYLSENKNKVFLYDAHLPDYWFPLVVDREPDKHGPWTLYTRKEALKLNLIPFVKICLTLPKISVKFKK